MEKFVSGNFFQRDISDGSFRALASSFGTLINAEVGLTMMMPGCFTKTLKERRQAIKLLMYHDTSRPCGVVKKAWEDIEGLMVDAKLSSTREGKEALEMLRDGSIDRVSIGFNVTKYDLVDINKEIVRRVHEAMLWEVSLVVFPADPNAVVTEVASRKKADVDKHYRFKTGRPLSVTEAYVYESKQAAITGKPHPDYELFERTYHTVMDDKEMERRIDALYQSKINDLYCEVTRGLL